MAKVKARRRVKTASASSVAKDRTWAPVPDPAPGSTGPIYMSFPAPPDEDALTEAASYLESLEARKQIAREPGPLATKATHQLEIDPSGRKRLVRKRFSVR